MSAGERTHESDPTAFRRQVRDAIAALAPDDATIVRLQHLDGMTHAEISATLGIALATVKSRSYRAHRRLAERLGLLRGADVRTTSTGLRLATRP